MARNITRKGLVRKLDKLVSQIVIARDKRCVCCGTTQNLTGGHLFSRVAYSTRWDLNNVFAQCLSCNLRHEYDSFPLTNFYIKRFGWEAYEKLHQKYGQVAKYKDFQLQELADELEKVLSQLK